MPLCLSCRFALCHAAMLAVKALLLRRLIILSIAYAFAAICYARLPIFPARRHPFLSPLMEQERREIGFFRVYATISSCLSSREARSRLFQDAEVIP